MAANRQVYQGLSANGLAGGSTSLKVDGSGTPVVRKIIPQFGSLAIARLTVFIQATGSILAANFGPIAQLATGCLFAKHLQAGDAVTMDLLDGEVIKDNGDFAMNGFDLTLEDFGSGDDYIVAEFGFDLKAGGPLIVNNDEYFAMTVQDDLTSITDGRAWVSGLDLG
jgi:hypothetical protein